MRKQTGGNDPPAMRPSYPWFGYPITEDRGAVTLVMTPHFAALPPP